MDWLTIVFRIVHIGAVSIGFTVSALAAIIAFVLGLVAIRPTVPAMASTRYL